MKKSGFVLFTALMYMSILTFIYLVNLNMYSSQVKMNEEINISYQAQIMSRLAVEKVIAEKEKVVTSQISSKDQPPELSDSKELDTSHSKEESDVKTLPDESSVIINNPDQASVSEIQPDATAGSSNQEDIENNEAAVNSATSDQVKEVAAATQSSIPWTDGNWTMTFNQGHVSVELKNKVFSTTVFIVENGRQYKYNNVPYDQRTRE
ncbi:MAG TPA: hypothetical protein K8W25_00080 [Aerococcus urinaeequi]|uniref:Uncharacterized protein n=1 Tax=Aerococcus urinaeequi TaxID=51665 RepID=A0AA47IZF6_9LACT|nr:hypothetical protein [Aerococcus urinaeequi]MDT2760973.1 hypothetical protein [Aerococcus urinaeequi]WAT23754.1 hypothetical protein OZ415_05665 [Aerococcus urinaeequi]HJH00668.1 hypothetical protein [Aerococcus urinaeequi]